MCSSCGLVVATVLAVTVAVAAGPVAGAVWSAGGTGAAPAVLLRWDQPTCPRPGLHGCCIPG
jgi:hypothetical protein